MIDASAFTKYLKYERQYSTHTIQSYLNDLDQFAVYLMAHLEIGNLLKASHIHVRSWMVHLMQKDYKPKSINRKLSTLKSFYKFQKKIGKIETNPASSISGPKLSKRLPQVVREKDLDIGLSLTAESRSFSELRDLLIFNLLYQTGIRRSELIELRSADVDTSRLTIKVLGKGNKERLVPISKELCHLIKEYQRVKSQESFVESDILILTDKGNKMYPKFVYNKVTAWIASISTIDKRSPHVLRHSFATHLADNGAEINAIKELLGHSSLAATEIYTHNSIERLKDVYGKAHPRALKKR